MTVTYTSPNHTIWGIRIANPISDERFTNADNLLKKANTSRLAWDIAVAPPKTLIDVDTLTKVGTIVRKLGITWGGDWVRRIDWPHFEVKRNWKMPRGYKLEGQVIVPSTVK